MLELAEKVPEAIKRVERKLPDDFAAWVWTQASEEMQRHAHAFLNATRMD